ncbi:uncharacterized protein LOC115765215 [Drosophila novamexicana]|uniref:uncharacterized protein LOC115765215 n=1 Tax=Drosophila novamexicana TaxID=47314 RepID=UPI0011E59B8B|nr:uncharacterized protein LOC115765215 [Drosophila novamexicana]
MTRNNQHQQGEEEQQLHKMFSSDAELLRDLAKTQSSRAQSPREKRVGLIAAMGHFRPKNATPIQFYNYVREFCIMHNCSIDEAMERAPDSWTKLSKDQRRLYNSEIHAALPIPVPRHLIYRAFQMERAGRWKISSMPAANGASTKYSVESYAPPVKPTKMQARLRAQQPRYDNLAETSPCCLESPRSPKKPQLRTLTPPEQRAQRAQQEKSTCSLSLTRILSEVSLKGMRSGRVKVMPAGKSLGEVATESKPQPQPAAISKSKKQLKVTSAVRKKQIAVKVKSAAKQPYPGLSKTDVKRKYPNNKKYKKKS